MVDIKEINNNIIDWIKQTRNYFRKESQMTMNKKEINGLMLVSIN